MHKSIIQKKQQNQVEEKISNLNKYVSELLELSPEYFNEFILNFNNQFDVNNFSRNSFLNRMDESFLLNIENLKSLSKDIVILLRNYEEKYKDDVLAFDQNNIADNNIKKIYENLTKMNKIFSMKLTTQLEKIQNDNNSNLSQKTKIISLDTFKKRTDKLICENNDSIESLKQIKKKYINNINNKKWNLFLYSLLFLFLLLSVTFLFLYFLK